MADVFGRGVSAVYQYADFAVWPTTGSWWPLSAYQRSDGANKSKANDPLLGVAGQLNDRDPNATAPELPTGGGPIEVPACLRELGFWLKAMLGEPVTTGSAPNYTHVFESGKAAIPYMAQSKKLAGGMYRRTRGIIVNTMGITFEKGSGYPRVQLGVLHRDELKNASQAGGTIEPAFTLLRVPSAKPYAKYNGAAMLVQSANINFSNQLEPDNQFDGTQDEWPNGYDPGETQISGGFTVRYKDTTWDDVADADTAGLFEFGWQLNVNQSIAFQLRAEIAKQALPVTSPQRVMQTYNLVPKQSDTVPAMKVTLKTDVNAYPPSPPPPPPP